MPSSNAQRRYAPSFLGSTAALIAAAVASQAISFGGTLVTARLYGPAEVGMFGLFNVAFTLAVFAASWRYELAIVTVDDDDEADDVSLFVVLAGVASALLAAAILLFLEAVPDGGGLSPTLRRSLVALPLSLVLASLILAGTNLCVRQRRFARFAAQQVLLAVITVAVQIALADTQPPVGGLVVGFIAGQFAAVLLLAPVLGPALAAGWRRASLGRRMRRVAGEHRAHFLYTVPFSALTQLYYQVPLMVLAGLFGPKEVGFYSLAFRTTYTPIGLIPSAVAQVLFPEMARDRDRIGRWEPRLLGLLVALGVILAPFAAVLLIFGPELYAVALGERWREAGLFAQIMIVPNLLNGLASGYDRVYFVLQRQRTALIVVGIVCAFSALLMIAADQVGGTPAWLVGAWAAGHLVMALAWMATIYRIAGFSLRALGLRWGLVMAVLATLAVLLWFGRGVADGDVASVAIVSAAAAAYAIVMWRAARPLRALLKRDTP